MISITIDQASVNRITEALGDMAKQMPRHLAVALNRTTNTMAVQSAKELGGVIKLSGAGVKKSKVLKAAVKQKLKADPSHLSAKLQLWKGRPFPIKYLGAKAVVRKRKGNKVYKGVSYRPDAADKKRTAVDKGFLVGMYRDNWLLRTGTKRGPLVRILGPRPGDYYEQIKLEQKTVAVANERLPIEINRRIREVLLEKSGVIKLKSSKGTTA